MTADTPEGRKRAFVRRIVEARRIGEPVVFKADDATAEASTAGDAAIEYDDRTLRLELTAGERDRLEDLLEAYRVFKIEQPETRKASDGVVYLSAVTDAKHAADFLEAVFRDVYGLSERYELRA